MIVEYIAKLANLKFSPEEAKKLEDRFRRVLKYVEKLNELDTKGIEPTSHALDVVLSMRDDNVKQFKEADKILKNAPAGEGRFVEVPKVI